MITNEHIDSRFLESPDFVAGFIQGYHDAFLLRMPRKATLQEELSRVLSIEAATKNKSAAWFEGVFAGYKLRARLEGWKNGTASNTQPYLSGLAGTDGGADEVGSTSHVEMPLP